MQTSTEKICNKIDSAELNKSEYQNITVKIRYNLFEMLFLQDHPNFKT